MMCLGNVGDVDKVLRQPSVPCYHAHSSLASHAFLQTIVTKAMTCVVVLGGELSWEFKNSPLNKEKVFDMGHVWTFHIHQHMVDMSTFTLYVLRHFDITHYLNGQPLQSMIKDRWAQSCQPQC